MSSTPLAPVSPRAVGSAVGAGRRSSNTSGRGWLLPVFLFILLLGFVASLAMGSVTVPMTAAARLVRL